MPEVRDESLGTLLAWALERLGEPLTVADLAARAAVSPATLHRRFRAQLGTTPLEWLTGQRAPRRVARYSGTWRPSRGSVRPGANPRHGQESSRPDFSLAWNARTAGRWLDRLVDGLRSDATLIVRPTGKQLVLATMTGTGLVAR